jgi:hypothetical protein
MLFVCVLVSALFSYIGVHLMEPGPHRTEVLIQGAVFGTLTMLLVPPLLIKLGLEWPIALILGLTLGLAAAITPGIQASRKSDRL